MKGSTYRRCYCRDEDGKPLGKKCPQLTNRRHGTYALRQELPPRKDGTRRSFSRAGYTTAKEAQEDLDTVRALLALPDGDDADGQVRIGDLLEHVSRDRKAPLPDLNQVKLRFLSGQSLTSHTTVGEWLDEWLASRRGRRTGISRDEINIRKHLRPRIGPVRLDRLRVSHLVEMFDSIADDNETIVVENQNRREQVAKCKWGKPGVPPVSERGRLAAERAKLAEMPPFRHTVGPGTRQRIRSTLRAALNDAIAQQRFGITFNPAAHVEMDSGKRPKGVLWTEEHVERWQKTGEKPSAVMVWTPTQMGRFLEHAMDDRLYALFHLITFRGLRRGEAIGQRWTDIDLDAGLLTVAKQIVQDGWTVYEDDPKTDSGARTIALDSRTEMVLREHRARQLKERMAAGAAWTDTGRIFTQEDGNWLRPSKVTDHFMEMVEEIGLPPVRLHDLRHGAATIAHAGGGDIHYIKELLGHSSIAITSDTYAHLLPQVDRAVAEAAAKLVPLPRSSTS
ncbi:site-specific integrase [Streptomyces sp. DSM 42041]|uniref:Site-specific integrase n=1 Tax=Streptomyces hazeniae TaxID=3075538 RepID=A0ABU2NK07_9ACTN|nr:site-specific integrase [Streptomyces sp. DSM 42041]MDT0377321.1 site-specific integrase [Streptomyces sp. DSM 42041]